MYKKRDRKYSTHTCSSKLAVNRGLSLSKSLVTYLPEQVHLTHLINSVVLCSRVESGVHFVEQQYDLIWLTFRCYHSECYNVAKQYWKENTTHKLFENVIAGFQVGLAIHRGLVKNV